MQIIDDRVLHKADGCRTYQGLKVVAGIFVQRKKLFAFIEKNFACSAPGVLFDNCCSMNACIGA